MASHQNGEINYYEELGVSPHASPDEIRDAYRLHVRLLHPDHQTDPELKALAESQMRKLNRVYAVLSDAERRRQYNEDLLKSQGTIAVLLTSPALQPLRARVAWTGAIVLSAALLIWLAINSQPAGVQIRVPDIATSAPAPGSIPSATSQTPPGLERHQKDSASSEIAQLRAKLKAATSERDAAVLALNREGNAKPASATPVIPDPPETRPVPLPAAEIPQTLVARPLPTPGLPPLRTERAINRQLTGFWFYAKPAAGQTNKNQALYPPEYIEATIVEESGIVHGKLRARFEIADRLISPDVNFTFTGTQSGNQASGPWIGGGGAKGEVTLKLTSDNTLKLDWNASDLGTQLGLSSGTAILTRRID